MLHFFHEDSSCVSPQSHLEGALYFCQHIVFCTCQITVQSCNCSVLRWFMYIAVFAGMFVKLFCLGFNSFFCDWGHELNRCSWHTTHDVLSDIIWGATEAMCDLFRKICAWKLAKGTHDICALTSWVHYFLSYVTAQDVILALLK